MSEPPRVHLDDISQRLPPVLADVDDPVLPVLVVLMLVMVVGVVRPRVGVVVPDKVSDTPSVDPVVCVVRVVDRANVKPGSAASNLLTLLDLISTASAQDRIPSQTTLRGVGVRRTMSRG